MSNALDGEGGGGRHESKPSVLGAPSKGPVMAPANKTASMGIMGSMGTMGREDALKVSDTAMLVYFEDTPGGLGFIKAVKTTVEISRSAITGGMAVANRRHRDALLTLYGLAAPAQL